MVIYSERRTEAGRLAKWYRTVIDLRKKGTEYSLKSADEGKGVITLIVHLTGKHYQ